jgi:putative transposase
LIDQATGAGWEHRRACAYLELAESRAWRWWERREAGRLEDRPAGGRPVHGLLADERDAIIKLFDAWGETDRSHRKLAHRGSYEQLVWVSPATVRRVLAANGLVLRRPRRAGRSERRPFPEWASYTKHSIWIYDTTHFAGCPRVAVITIMDLVTRKWICEVVSGEETGTQVQVAFTDALQLEGLHELVAAHQDSLADRSLDAAVRRPILLAVSDNGPQMTSGSTREFMAMCAIAQHFGRPGTPTDQAWIESLFSHIKADWPHLEPSATPPSCAPNSPSPVSRTTRSDCTPPSATSPPMTSTKAAAPTSVAHAASGSCAPDDIASPTIAYSTVKANRRRAADAG